MQCPFFQNPALSPLLVAKDIGVDIKPNPTRHFQGSKGTRWVRSSDSSQALSFTPCNVAICHSFARIKVKPKDAAKANGKVLPLFALMSMSGCERRRSTTASCFPRMAKIRPLCGQFSFYSVYSVINLTIKTITCKRISQSQKIENEFNWKFAKRTSQLSIYLVNNSF